MRTPPTYWSDPDGARSIWAILLSPIAWLYDFIGRRKLATAKSHKASKPVICIGNATMGGVGKTPFACMLARILTDHGSDVAFLTRGYGGSAKGPVFVSTRHSASIVGDEPLLLSQFARTCVSRDRVKGADYIIKQAQPDLVVMDDGFQNPSLQKDFSFLLVDAETGFGNGLVFPSGPLREKPGHAVTRAQAVVFVLPYRDYPIEDQLAALVGDLPVFTVWLEAARMEQTCEVLAFSGIGRPQKFYETAARTGYTIRETADFPDHHSFTADDLKRLAERAERRGLSLLTTEKDFVRLPDEFKAKVKTLPVTMQIDKSDALMELLSPVTQRGGV